MYRFHSILTPKLIKQNWGQADDKQNILYPYFPKHPIVSDIGNKIYLIIKRRKTTKTKCLRLKKNPTQK